VIHLIEQFRRVPAFARVCRFRTSLARVLQVTPTGIIFRVEVEDHAKIPIYRHVFRQNYFAILEALG